MKRTLEDIRENMPFVGCDNATALEMCDEVERLRLFIRCIAPSYGDHERLIHRADDEGGADMADAIRRALEAENG